MDYLRWKMEFFVGLDGFDSERDAGFALIHVCNHMFPNGYTVTHGHGSWGGQQEPQATVTVFRHLPPTQREVEGWIEKLKDAMSQDAVLFSLTKVSAKVW